VRVVQEIAQHARDCISMQEIAECTGYIFKGRVQRKVCIAKIFV